jgi:alpha-1,2-mannosyltransferase
VVAVPLPLIAAGHWRTVLGCAAATLALAALSWLALGGDTWSAFIASITQTSGVFAGEAGKWTMYASLYGGQRFAGLGFTPALALHAILALAVLSVTIRAWRSPAASPELKAALICFAAVVATPRVLNYDLHILVIGALFQARHALRLGFYPGEQLLFGAVALAAFLSMLAPPAANPLLGLILFGGCWLGHVRRASPERPNP